VVSFRIHSPAYVGSIPASAISFLLIKKKNGEMAEWFNASDLKSERLKGLGGSNPSLSIIFVFGSNRI
jgi:hypothetical protein